MCQTTPIPSMNTIRMTLNILIQPPRQPIHRRKLNPESAGGPPSLPLKHPPKFPYLIADLNELIQTHAPSLRPLFLALLDRLDQTEPRA